MSEEIINDDIEDVIPVPEIVETKDDKGNDTTDYKALAEAQREVAEQNRGIAQRNKTRAERFKAKGEKPDGGKPDGGKSDVGKPGELDYGQKAFLVANGIKGADEVKLVAEELKISGGSLEELLDNPYFQEKLKTARQLKKSDDAGIPGNKRGSQVAKDTVEYWLAKPFGELPDDVELRRKVVNARIKAEKNTNVFGVTPQK